MDVNLIDQLSGLSLIGSGRYLILLNDDKVNRPLFVLRDIVLDKQNAESIFYSLFEVNGCTAAFDHGNRIDDSFSEVFKQFDRILFSPRPSAKHGVVYSLMVTSNKQSTAAHDLPATIHHINKVIKLDPKRWCIDNIRRVDEHVPFHYLETAFIFSDLFDVSPPSRLNVKKHYDIEKISFIYGLKNKQHTHSQVDMTLFDCAGMSLLEIQKKKIEDHFVKSTYNPLTPKAIGLGVIDKVELAKAPSETPNKITMIPIDKIRPEIGKTVLFAYAVYGAECVAWSIGKLVRVIEDESGTRYEIINELCQPIVANYWTSLPSKWL